MRGAKKEGVDHSSFVRSFVRGDNCQCTFFFFSFLLFLVGGRIDPNGSSRRWYKGKGTRDKGQGKGTRKEGSKKGRLIVSVEFFFFFWR